MPTVIPGYPTRQERLADLQKMAERAFKDHVLYDAQKDRWHLRPPDTTMYWIEIAALRGNRILVHGDIGTHMFGIWSGNGWPKGALRWVGNMWNSPRYAREKTNIAMDSGAGETYDVDIAKRDVLDLIQMYKEEYIQDPRDAEEYTPVLDGLYDALDDMRFGRSQHDVISDVVEATNDFELTYMGRCIKPSVVYAIAGVRKLLELLEDTDEG